MHPTDDHDADLAPVRCNVTVPTTPREAFRMFTAEIDGWWPLATHSVSGGRAAGCVLEPRTGGTIHELSDDGTVHLWGTVTAWDPPHRIVFIWHPGRDASTAQEVELRFVAADDGTRVELEHRRWDRFTGDAAAARDRYEHGWPPVLERFEARARAAP